MNKLPEGYKSLLIEMCRALQITAENARDTYEDDVDYQLKTDARALEIKLENDELLTPADIRTAYLCSLVSQMLIQGRIDQYRVSLEVYRTIVDPKLKYIIDNTITDKQEILSVLSVDE